MKQVKPVAGILIHVLFWSWNAIFLAFVMFGFVPLVGLQLFDAVRMGLVPWPFLAYGLTLVGIPVFAVAVGAIFLRRSPWKLFALGYGIQAPLLVATAGRLFAIREIMPGVSFLLGLATVGMLSLLWQLLDSKTDAQHGIFAILRTVGLTMLLLVGLYASLWIGFYVLPVASAVVRAAIEFARNLPYTLTQANGMPLQAIPFMLLGTILMLFSGTLFVVLPVAVPIIYGYSWWRSIRTLWQRVYHPLAVGLPVAVIALCALGFVLTNQQPQQQAFTRLENPPASVQEAKAILQEKDALRTGLLNAYLASYRYTSAVGEVVHIQYLYMSELRFSDAQASTVQSWYDAISRPFLYEPATPDAAAAPSQPANTAMSKDASRAAELYQRIFDQPINKAELPTIVQSVRSTWNRDMATEAWQAVDDREILLTRQELTVSEHGDWADVELYEAYQNQTAQRQEVVYYFSLPESAVITGLWLGDSDDRTQRYSYQVAPRGAAQSTYRSEVRRNVDPALVEQIGPSQYRLRVFPIEPPSWRWDTAQGRSTVNEAPQMHLWMTWRVMAKENAWLQPQLNDKRNVYWDRSTTRLVNGQPIPGDLETWLPASVPAINSTAPSVHRVAFDDGTTIIAEPGNDSTEAIATVTHLHLAVILDRSRSMDAHANDVKEALTRLRDLKLSAPVDVYLTAADYSGLKPALVELSSLTPDQLVYYGGQNPGDLLRQFTALQNGRTYDAILVLTDDSGYEMGADPQKVTPPGAPVWMVHLGGKLPLGYNDNTLEAIQSSGGSVATTLNEAIERIGMAASQQRQTAGRYADVVDGYRWQVIPAGEKAADSVSGGQQHTQDDPFAALAARRLILSQMQQHHGQLSQVGTLDLLNKVAVRQSIVTPYSSMIVLVNEAQKQRLADAEKRGDRFDREYEQIGETTPEGQPVVTAVPEPEEWLLIGLTVALLGLLLWRRRRATQSTGAAG